MRQQRRRRHGRRGGGGVPPGCAQTHPAAETPRPAQRRRPWHCGDTHTHTLTHTPATTTHTLYKLLSAQSHTVSLAGLSSTVSRMQRPPSSLPLLAILRREVAAGTARVAACTPRSAARLPRSMRGAWLPHGLPSPGAAARHPGHTHHVQRGVCAVRSCGAQPTHGAPPCDTFKSSDLPAKAQC
jgi:hypothetical protein